MPERLGRGIRERLSPPLRRRRERCPAAALDRGGRVGHASDCRRALPSDRGSAAPRVSIAGRPAIRPGSPTRSPRARRLAARRRPRRLGGARRAAADRSAGLRLGRRSTRSSSATGRACTSRPRLRFHARSRSRAEVIERYGADESLPGGRRGALDRRRRRDRLLAGGAARARLRRPAWSATAAAACGCAPSHGSYYLPGGCTLADLRDGARAAARAARRDGGRLARRAGAARRPRGAGAGAGLARPAAAGYTRAAPAAVAQLARASACHAEGRGFESLQPLLERPW